MFIELYLQGEKLKLQERLLREREREALERKSQERYRRLLDAMPQCIWAADAERAGQLLEPAPASRTAGSTPATCREESFWECLHPDDRAEARAHWEARPAQRRPVRAPGAASSAPPTAATAGTWRAPCPSASDDGAIVGWIATATDIDDQKQAEEALRKAIILRDDFLSVASHELRTPLTSLKLEVANLSRHRPARRQRRRARA